MLDRNKTNLTHKLTLTAVRWLNNARMRFIEREVSYYDYDVNKSYIADILGFEHCSWHLLASLCLIIRGTHEILIVKQPICALMEVKATRQDFLNDKEKFSKQYAHFNCLVYPRNLIAVDEIPRGWYGLEICSTGERVHRFRKDRGYIYQMNDEEIKDMIYNTCMRKFNRETYDWWRDMHADIYGQESPRAAVGRLVQLMSLALRKIDESPDLLLQDHVRYLIKKSYLHPELQKFAKKLNNRIEELCQKKV